MTDASYFSRGFGDNAPTGTPSSDYVFEYYQSTGHWIKDENGNTYLIAPVRNWTEETKTIASGVVATSIDRNLVIAAESGTSDDLIEITGLTIGDKVWLRADSGDTITVKHNDAGATIKILIQDDADETLDENHPLELVLTTATTLVQLYRA